MNKPHYIAIDRSQMSWQQFDVEALIPLGHPARAIWEMSGRFDLSRFEQAVRNQQGEGGRPCWPPRLLFAVWVYGYSQGVASARALERMMEYEPGLRWLCGAQVINYHTLSDFRITQQAQLEDLMSQLLAILDHEQLIDLRTIAHDGTKIGAVASKHSFHRRRTIGERLRAARRVVRELSEKAEHEAGGDAADGRRQAAEQRAAQERLQRLESSLRKLQREQQKAAPGQREAVRVSVSEPQARKMKQADGGWAPSYNLQLSTETKHRIIVGVRVCDAAADAQQLQAGVATVRRLCGRAPARVLADGGYASRENVSALHAQQIELVAPWKDAGRREAGAAVAAGRAPEFASAAFQSSADGQSLRCPAGRELKVLQQRKHHGQQCTVYQAAAADCADCAMREACCGRRRGPRRVAQVQESRAMQAYLERMREPETQALYRKRSEVAEFPNLWIKSHWKLQRFSVRGLQKVAKEALWAAMAYNIQQWIRIQWAPAA